ncbi:MAG: AlkZ family DNA glycosylase [Anaerolineae bacterium]|nr:AlkZ family DNA glycosylase [Anaerolineae bacterium]
MLLERSALPVPAAIERLVGLQAQLALPPYVGLWTRLNDFKRDDLAALIENHTVVKATLMRGTLHLFTADDYLRFRMTIQPALDKGFEAISKRRDSSLDFDHILQLGRDYLAEAPHTFAEITAMFIERLPNADPGAMRYAVRMLLPLVQVPISSGWSYPGNPQFTLAESWLGKPIPTEDNLRDLALRYLAAFGPATAVDMQTWSSLPGLKTVFDKLKPDLRVYHDEKMRDLYDLPDIPLPDMDAPAPVRFLPEFDNLLLSHKDRTRIVADKYRKQVYLPALRVAATILVDGFVRGGWKIEKTKQQATLVIEPWDTLSKTDRAALTEAAERLVRFIESGAKTYAVRFTDS